MLTVGRKAGESIAIGEIVIEVGAIRGKTAELRIEFPPDLLIQLDGIKFRLAGKGMTMESGTSIYREVELGV